MMRKLRDTGDGNGYTATALILAEWDDPPGSGTAVRIREHEVPDDVATPQFFSALVHQVLAASLPFTMPRDKRSPRPGGAVSFRSWR